MQSCAGMRSGSSRLQRRCHQCHGKANGICPTCELPAREEDGGSRRPRWWEISTGIGPLGMTPIPIQMQDSVIPFAFVGSFGRFFFSFWAASLLLERLGAAESARAFVDTDTFAKLWQWEQIHCDSWVCLPSSVHVHQKVVHLHRLRPLPQ